MTTSDWRGWPELVTQPEKVEKGDRLLVRWGDGTESTVQVDNVDKIGEQYLLDVTLLPIPEDLPTFYSR